MLKSKGKTCIKACMVEELSQVKQLSLTTCVQYTVIGLRSERKLAEHTQKGLVRMLIMRITIRNEILLIPPK